MVEPQYRRAGRPLRYKKQLHDDELGLMQRNDSGTSRLYGGVKTRGSDAAHKRRGANKAELTAQTVDRID